MRPSRGGGEPTDQAGRAEHGESRQQHSLAAEAVREAPRGQDQRGEHQVVGVDHPLQLARGGVQLAHEAGQGHVDDGRVEVDGERGEEQRHQYQGLGAHEGHA
jgi:hypothetical protein